MNFYELPCLDRRKSFYGKAHVIEADGQKILRSYETNVCRIDSDGSFHRLWSGYSATTMRHIDSFRKLNGLPMIGKAGWDKLELED